MSFHSAMVNVEVAADTVCVCVCVCVSINQYVDRFPLPYAIETTSIQANRAPTGDLVVTAAINDSSEDSGTENC